MLALLGLTCAKDYKCVCKCGQKFSDGVQAHIASNLHCMYVQKLAMYPQEDYMKTHAREFETYPQSTFLQIFPITYPFQNQGTYFYNHATGENGWPSRWGSGRNLYYNGCFTSYP